MSKRTQRGETQAETNGVRVTAPHAPGVQTFGAYRPGQTYTVTPDEAHRLVRCKGFVIADSQE